MSRSIFDPTGPNTERSGSTFTGPDASQGSQMPTDVADGVVESPDTKTDPDRSEATEAIASEAAAGLGTVVSPAIGNPGDSIFKRDDELSNPGQHPLE